MQREEQIIQESQIEEITVEEMPIEVSKQQNIKPSAVLDELVIKQNQILAEQQLQSKFGHYETVRRQTLGVINSLELGVITIDSLNSIVENSIITAPNYWLTYANSAVSYWYMDNKEKAEKSMIKALDLNNANSSLFFALACYKENRINASNKWLQRYISSLDPRKTYNEVVYLFDALCSGNLGQIGKNLVLSKYDEWKKLLLSDTEIKKEVKLLWKTFFEENIYEADPELFPYLNGHCENFDNVLDMLLISGTTNNIFAQIQSMVDSDDETNTGVSQILQSMINIPEPEERIIKNQNNDFSSILYHMSKMLLGLDEYVLSKNTRKFALALLKEIIIEAYDDFTRTYFPNDIIPITVVVDTWVAESIDGSNEYEMHESLDEHFHELLDNAVEEFSYINIPVIASALILILVSVIFKDNIILTILLLGATMAIVFTHLFFTDKKRKIQEGKNSEFKNEYKSVLNNIIAEIVDYSRVQKVSDERFENLVHYLDDFSNSNLIDSNYRDINIGGDKDE